MKGRFSLVELAQRAEIPGRTIRFYIARGILQGPLHAGRGAEYDGRHLARIAAIRALQGRGLTLAEIAAAGVENQGALALPKATPSLRYSLGEDAEVYVRADLPPWRLNRIRKAIGTLQHLIQEKPENAKDRE